MQPQATVSWKQQAIGVGVVIVASGAVLISSIIPSRLCPSSPEQEVIALKNEQRLQTLLDEARRPSADFRLRLEHHLRAHVTQPANNVSDPLAEEDQTDQSMLVKNTNSPTLEQVC